MSVNEKKWLVMHVHVQMRLDKRQQLHCVKSMLSWSPRRMPACRVACFGPLVFAQCVVVTSSLCKLRSMQCIKPCALAVTMPHNTMRLLTLVPGTISVLSLLSNPSPSLLLRAWCSRLTQEKLSTG